MEIKIIFEDNENTPSSILLRKCSNGENIIFANGASRVRGTLEKVYNEEDYFIVLYDLVPDNGMTIMLYRALKEAVNIYSNVVVIPIVCIEQIILRMLDDLGYLTKTKITINLIDNLVSKFSWSNLTEEDKKEISGKSLEKVYKLILNNQLDKCFVNSNDTSKRVETGRFYKEDCACNRKYCRFDCTDNLKIKAERLYSWLPVFEKDISYKAMQQKVQDVCK